MVLLLVVLQLQVNKQTFGIEILIYALIFFISVPGGSVAQDGDKLCKTNACIFEASDDMASMRSFEQVIFSLYHRAF